MLNIVLLSNEEDDIAFGLMLVNIVLLLEIH